MVGTAHLNARAPRASAPGVEKQSAISAYAAGVQGSAIKRPPWESREAVAFGGCT